jgi:hypothetical protein
MAKSILVTISLSNDMISRVEKDDALPNPLHIGYYESLRLLGMDWKNGPLMKFLESCYMESEKDMGIIHVRDWHSLADPSQKHELSIYGPHCMENTWGAEFVWENKGILKERGNTYTVNSTKILAASEDIFKDALDKAIGNTDKSDVRIGIIGVLTNIKVEEMAIALQGFYNMDNIAVCSALTASNNIRRHFQGLEDLSNMYGVKVFNSIKQFGNWLNVRTRASLGLRGFDVPSIGYIERVKLFEEEKRIAEYLFRDCKSIRIKELSGGYSGSKVLFVNSVDRHGFQLAPTIMKLDSMEKIGKERVGFEKVQYILGPHVPKIVNSVETEKGAGIRYSFAMMNKNSNARTFKEFFMSVKGTKKDISRLEKNVSILFDEILTPLYSNWTLEKKQLWSSNTFTPERCSKIRDNIMKILGHEPRGDTISFKGVGDFANPTLFYSEKNINELLKRKVSYVRQALSHGDLNAGNIILDDNLNMWLIDFSHTDYYYHVIQDIVKLENDLKFIHTPIDSNEELSQLVEFERILMRQKKLSDNIRLPGMLAKNKKIARLHKTVRMLREFAFRVSADEDMNNYRIPQLRYSAHNLGFDESDAMQKKYALISTSMLCEYFLENNGQRA